MSSTSFDELLRRLVEAEDLRAMKEAAGPSRDIADLEDLDAIQ